MPIIFTSHSIKVTTYAPQFRALFGIETAEFVYCIFSSHILGKMEKCRISTPIFRQNLTKCIISTQLSRTQILQRFESIGRAEHPYPKIST